MRLLKFGIFVVAAVFPLWAHSQQPTPAAADSSDDEAQQASAPAHAVTPPKVTCSGNTLSISANYSALGAILSEVQRCAGVQFEAPETAKSSLIFDEIGPGPSGDVLAELLTASGFGYIIGASGTDPAKIESVMLFARDAKDAGAGSDTRGSSPGRRAFAQMREAARPKTPEEQAAMAAEMERADPDAAPSPQPAQPEPSPVKNEATATKAAADTQAGDGQGTPSQPGQAPAQTKTTADAQPANTDVSPTPPPQDTAASGRQSSPTDDRIANMQSLFEQRKQMMQQQQQQQHPAPQ